MSNHSYPFHMTDLLPHIPDLVIRHTGGQTVTADCLQCGRRGKMYIHLAKDVFNCVRCECHGGMLDLYAVYKNPSHCLADELSQKQARREALEEIRTMLRLDLSLPAAKRPNPVAEMPQSPLASAAVRHATYTRLLSLLELRPAHRIDLLRRGLTDAQIVQYGYKSTPAPGSNLAAVLLEQGCTLAGVPGFYLDGNGRWRIDWKLKGYLVPYRNAKGMIQALQVRLDRPIEKHKYFWVSSAGKNLGTGSGAPLHIAGQPHVQKLIITEGALKGTVAHALSGGTFLCNAGVSQTEAIIRLMPRLKAQGVTEIQTAYDMDLKANADVQKHCSKLLSAARRHGFSVSWLDWEKENKGVDDHYWARHLKSLLLARAAAAYPAGDTERFCRQIEFGQWPSDTLLYLLYHRELGGWIQTAARLEPAGLAAGIRQEMKMRKGWQACLGDFPPEKWQETLGR